MIQRLERKKFLKKKTKQKTVNPYQGYRLTFFRQEQGGPLKQNDREYFENCTFSKMGPN